MSQVPGEPLKMAGFHHLLLVPTLEAIKKGSLVAKFAVSHSNYTSAAVGQHQAIKMRLYTTAAAFIAYPVSVKLVQFRPGPSVLHNRR